MSSTPPIHAPIIVLVAPQLGENIGAAARAMGNFGLSDLRLVTPRDGWPNPAAEAMAAHALPVVQKARIFDSLAEALADCHFVYATTARRRELNKPVVSSRDFPRHPGKTAILFGRESSGLSNEELALAQGILTIPVAPDCPSINLAQAVLLTAYEWHQQNQSYTSDTLDLPAPQNELQGFFEQLESTLDASNFWKTPEKKDKMWQNLRAIFLRATPSNQEVQTLRGVLSALKRNNN